MHDVVWTKTNSKTWIPKLHVSRAKETSEPLKTPSFHWWDVLSLDASVWTYAWILQNFHNGCILQVSTTGVTVSRLQAWRASGQRNCDGCQLLLVVPWLRLLTAAILLAPSWVWGSTSIPTGPVVWDPREPGLVAQKRLVMWIAQEPQDSNFALNMITMLLWVHSSVARAADCRSAGPWLKSGCALHLSVWFHFACQNKSILGIASALKSFLESCCICCGVETCNSS